MDDKKTARLLRKQGFSYGEINRALTRKRPKSTLSYWFKDIPLSEYRKEELRERFAPKLAAAREKAIEAKRAKRERRLKEIEERNSGIKQVLGNPDARKALLGVLYAANGAKKAFSFSSSNPDIIRLYLYLLRTSFRIDESKLRCTVLARADSPLPELTYYWAKETAIPTEQFYTTRKDARTIGKDARKGSFGTCRIEYMSADLFREVMSIGSILTSSGRIYTGL